MLALEVVSLPVTDTDRALAFYVEQAGFVLDVDYHPTAEFRVVQLTPPGSAGGWSTGLDPQRRDYASFADFADPDGNTWTLQERGHRA